MSTDFVAAICPKSERYQEWLEVMGCDQMPLKSPIPIRADLPGRDNASVYLIDLPSLTQEQRERLLKFLARKFHLEDWEARSEIDEVGVPVLDEDVMVTVFNPQKWI